MNWDLIVDRDVKKQLKKLPKQDAQRITDTIDGLSVNPYAGDIQKIKGEEMMWRRRVGEYRIFYQLFDEQKKIYVFEVRRRTSTTY